MDTIEQLKKEGRNIYPITTPKAVRDENGHTIQDIIDGTVRVDLEQTFTPEEKQQARENIGTIPEAPEDDKQYGRKNGEWAEIEGSIDSRTVTEETPTSEFPYIEYTPQALTDEQKAQARANIGITIYNGEVI